MLNFSYDDDVDRQRELARRWGLYEEPQPLQHPEPARHSQTGAEWVAYWNGSRWCRKCKSDARATAESCDMCGERTFGRVA